MRDPRRRLGRLTAPLGAIVVAAVAVLGCGKGGGPGSQDLGSMRAAVSFTPADGVSAVRIDVSQSGALVMTRTIPVSGKTPDGAPAGDAFFVVPPGDYTVTATALDANGKASRTCMSATASATVVSGQTTEVTLSLFCGEPQNGGLDVVIRAEHAPSITNLVFDPSKFGLACQPVTIAVTASSPDNLPLTYAWGVVSTPPNPQLPVNVSSLLVPMGMTAVVDTATPGDYSFSVTVTDSNKHAASLTFPVHILPNGQCLAAPLPTPPDPLPAPPRERGCYQYASGWQAIPCLADGVAESQYGHPAAPVALSSDPPSMGTALPLVFGQNQATFQAVDTETDQFVDRMLPDICPSSGSDHPNRWSFQDNTNIFTGNNGDGDALQFTIQSDGGSNAVCVWNIDVTTQNYHSKCVSASQRPGGLMANDSVNIASFVDAVDGTVSLTAQLSWAAPGATNIFAVVDDDKYGLAGNWLKFDGAVLGMGNCSNALFTSTWIDESLMVSSCVGDTTMGSPDCGGQALRPNVSEQTVTATIETNDLTVVAPPSVGFLNSDLAVTDFTSTTGGFDTTNPAIRPVTGVLCPHTLVNGDREFGGNGPQITVNAATVVAPNQKGFRITVDFDAVETGGDHSEVTGHFEPFIWTAPAGKHIVSVLSGTSSMVSALSASAGPEFGICNDGDVITNPTITGDLIGSIQLIGDTGSDDISDDADCHCDTQIKSIGFNLVTVQLAND